MKKEEKKRTKRKIGGQPIKIIRLFVEFPRGGKKKPSSTHRFPVVYKGEKRRREKARKKQKSVKKKLNPQTHERACEEKQDSFKSR